MTIAFFVRISWLFATLGLACAAGWSLHGKDAGPSHWTYIEWPNLFGRDDHESVVTQKDTKVIGDASPGHEGFYLRLSSKSGAQLWSYVNEHKLVAGFDPHFEGKSRMQLCIGSPGSILESMQTYIRDLPSE
jgi:hypothetical protein